MSTLWIHAGPHKTASTYIQKHLKINKAYLRKNNLVWAKRAAKLEFSRLLKSENWQELCELSFLRRKLKKKRLISEEKLHPAILEIEKIQTLEKVAEKTGLKIGIVFYIRDQAEWINSMYCHGIRHMYHSTEFAEYAKSWLYQTNYWTLDLQAKYENLINSNLKTKFIVLSRANKNDPFESLLRSIDISFDPKCLAPVPDDHANIQPGIKGIWLSKACKFICDALDFDTDNLARKGNGIRLIALRKGWHCDQFYGFDDDLYDEVRNHFSQSNKIFFEAYLGGSWERHFPRNNKIQNLYNGPSTSGEFEELEDVLMEALESMGFPVSDLSKASDLFKQYCVDGGFLHPQHKN